MVSGDAHRWRQILLNYLDNAVKFTKSGSVDLSVEVAGRRDGRIGLRASVRDTGCGIDPDKLQFIFEKFTQADSSMTRGHGGTGLGLAIVRQLAALMGGSAGVESEAGHGSHFWATAWFEAIQPTAVWPAEKFSAPAIETRMDGRHVLLVEDNSINQKVVERMLERLGCMVIIAANGEEALRRMESHRVDLVLMDVMMPVMDGLEATRRIRQMPSPAGRVPVIILSASAMTEDRERAIAAGADRFIAKPVSIESLEEALSVRLS
jgi:CheY-like chemotaxis protein